jgi:hypothetical protein
MTSYLEFQRRVENDYNTGLLTEHQHDLLKNFFNVMGDREQALELLVQMNMENYRDYMTDDKQIFSSSHGYAILFFEKRFCEKPLEYILQETRRRLH